MAREPDPRLAVAVLALLAALAFQGSRGLWETTEGRYAECAREMLESGDWLEPTLSGEPHWTKPPFAYQATAAGLTVFGVNTWGARLPVAFAFLATVLLVGATGRRLWGRQGGWLAALVYACSPLPVAGAAVVSADTFLTLWVALGLFAYVTAWKRGGRRWAAVFWAAFGLAFYTKGSPALLFLGGIVAFHLHARRPCRIFTVPGVALFLVLGFGWYGWIELRHPGLLGEIVRSEVLDRNLTASAGRNPEWYAPLAIYLPTLLFAGGAFGYWAVRLLRRSGLRGIVGRGTTGGLLLWFILLPLVAFSLVRSRLPFYLLPLSPAIALALARAMMRVSRRPLRRAMAVGAATVLLLVALKGASALVGIEVKGDMRFLHMAIEGPRGEQGEVWAFEERYLHGLEFYLQRPIRRIRATPEDLAALRARAEEVRVVVVAGEGAGQWLEDRLDWENDNRSAGKTEWRFFWNGPETPAGDR